AQVNKNSIAYDNCTGTGGFLISAMKKMIKDAKGDKIKEQEIKSKQLIGTEYQSHIFALAVSNMYIHQDGKTNIINGSCFDEEVIEEVKAKKPTVGFLNPPYKSDKNELDFVLNNLECLVDGGTCIAIVPMERALSKKGLTYELKKKLLEKHTLNAVLSMPNELFNDSKANAVTSVLIFTAHRRHDNNVETYFGYYKDDGFIIKRKGRINVLGDWKTRLEKWVNYYKRGKEEAGFSVKKCIDANSEWCAEAYLETNYKILSVDNFKKKIKGYLSYLLTKPLNQDDINIDPASKSKNSMVLELQTDKWGYFNYKDIFVIKKGKRLTKEDQEDGEIPYVSSSSLNNGVDNYIDNGFTDENCLSFACYGSIGEIFYQKEKSWISDNCNAIYLKNKKFTADIALFIATIMELEKIKFSYGMTAKKERLSTFKIKLPAKNNQPDWEFMENFIKSLPYSSSL
ncbi:MAG: restriction endonuclease subunit S, partial [bacterium]